MGRWMVVEPDPDHAPFRTVTIEDAVTEYPNRSPSRMGFIEAKMCSKVRGHRVPVEAFGEAALIPEDDFGPHQGQRHTLPQVPR
jgi:hypothetical protein